MSEQTPLTVEVSHGELVIRIGIETLKFAAEHMDSCMRYVERLKDWKQMWAITDPIQFAKDVVSELRDESENGSTDVTDLIEKACLAAIENGSAGCEETE